jgi:hypothetical protein
LQLSAVGASAKHVDMQQGTFGFEASSFRIHEFLLNCANLQKKAEVIDVILCETIVSD